MERVVPVNRPYLKDMTQTARTHLDQLEHQSIFIFERLITPSKTPPCRGRCGRTAMFSFGSRANPEMLEFWDWATKHYNLNLNVKINTEARERGIGYENTTR